MILIAIRFSPLIQRLVRRKGRKKKNKIIIHLGSSAAIAAVTNLLIQNDYRIENLSVKDLANGEVRVQVRCLAIEQSMLKDVYTLLKTEPEVLSVELFEN